MIQAWQYRLLDNKPIVRHEYRSGIYNETLAAGDYRITLIGAGGGGVGAQAQAAAFSWVQGGVGGTLQVEVSIATDTEITINVGAGQTPRTGNYDGSNVEFQAHNGGNTTITGIPDVVLVANGGTGAKFITAGTGGVRTVGVMGSTEVSGVKRVLINNPNEIKSKGGYFLLPGTTREPTLCLNTNYPDNTKFGAGGDAGWRTGPTVQGTIVGFFSGDGYVLIETI